MVPQSIGILGKNGFIGSSLDLDAVGITKENYEPRTCNVFINANGNSKKFLPELDPLVDFDLTVRNTIKSIIDFPCELYIYISSCEVYGENTREDAIIDVESISRYALSKYLAECLVRKYCKKWLILRLNGPIGKNLKKGPLYDITKGGKLWISANSQFQFIHTNYISSLIKYLIDKEITNEIINVTGKDVVSLRDVMVLLGKEVPYPEEPIIKHNFNISKADAILSVPSSYESLGIYEAESRLL